MRRILSLDGTWLIRADPKCLGELYPDELNHSHAGDARWMRRDLDEASWASGRVPGPWNQVHDASEVQWFRKTFAFDRRDSERAWLRFEGVDYIADVWLNEVYLGSHEGFVGGFGWEVTDLLAASNLMVLRVESPVDARGELHEYGQLKQTVRGALHRWDMNDPELIPGGVWGSVSMVATGVASVERLEVTGAPAAQERLDPDLPHAATIELAVELSAAVPGDHQIEIVVETRDGTVLRRHRESVHLGPRTCAHHLRLHLEQAQLWWPWDLGDPVLHRVTVSLTSPDGLQEDRACARVGIRSVARREGTSLYVNGHRYFQRGANYLASQELSAVSQSDYERDVALAKEANLNTLHAFCVVERDAFYEVCDREGVLVYQDFPIWMTAANSSDLVRRATAQAEEMVTRLRGHPCIAVWNMGSQPSPANMEKLNAALVRQARRLDPTRVVQHGNATYSYAGEPVHATRSYFWPLDADQRWVDMFDWRGDRHIYAGWYFGTVEDLRILPRQHLEFVSEFGAQSLPSASSLRHMLGDAAHPPDWAAYARRGAQPNLIRAHLDEDASLEAMVESSQRYQAELLRLTIEFLRCHKYAPTNGLHVFAFVDCWPSISWSIIEHDRTPKLAYFAVRDAMNPVQAFVTAAARGAAELVVTGRIANDTAIPVDAVITVRDAESGVTGKVSLLASIAASTPFEVGLAGCDGRGGLELEIHDADGQLLATQQYPPELLAAATRLHA